MDAAADRDAVAKATTLGKLRPNSVDSIIGEKLRDTGLTPIIHFDQWEEDDIGGSRFHGRRLRENEHPGAVAHRAAGISDVPIAPEGARKCILY
jgi:fumarate hydratase class I